MRGTNQVIVRFLPERMSRLVHEWVLMMQEEILLALEDKLVARGMDVLAAVRHLRIVGIFRLVDVLLHRAAGHGAPVVVSTPLRFRLA